MAINQPQNDEIDLRILLKLLFESKKIIISTTLIFALIGVVVFSLEKNPTSEYKANVMIEIGMRNIQNQSLIESAQSLKQDLIVNFIHKQQQRNLIFKDLENILILVEFTSSSSLEAQELLSQIVEYSEGKHLKIQNNENEKIFNTIISLRNKIDFLVANNQEEKGHISSRINNMLDTLINNLNEETLWIDTKIKAFQDHILVLKNNHVNLTYKTQAQLEIYNINSRNNFKSIEEVIFDLEIELLNLKYQRTELLNEVDIFEKSFEAFQLDGVNLSTLNSLQSALKKLERMNISSNISSRLMNVTKSIGNISNLVKNKNALEEEFNKLALNQTKTKATREIQVTEIKKSKSIKSIIFSLIAGVFLSFLIIFVNVFLKNKED